MAASNLYILYKTSLGETGCLGNPYLICWLPKHPVFLFTPHSAAPVWLAGHYATPLVTGCFPPWPIPRGWRISLGVAIILGICLCSHTYLDCNQFVILLKFVFIHANIVKILLMVKTLIKKY